MTNRLMVFCLLPRVHARLHKEQEPSSVFDWFLLRWCVGEWCHLQWTDSCGGVVGNCSMMKLVAMNHGTHVGLNLPPVMPWIIQTLFGKSALTDVSCSGLNLRCILNFIFLPVWLKIVLTRLNVTAEPLQIVPSLFPLDGLWRQIWESFTLSGQLASWHDLQFKIFVFVSLHLFWM